MGRGGRSVAGRMGKVGSAGERRDGPGLRARPRAGTPAAELRAAAARDFGTTTPARGDPALSPHAPSLFPPIHCPRTPPRGAPQHPAGAFSFHGPRRFPWLQ